MATVASRTRSILTPHFSKPVFEEVIPPAPSAEPAPVGEEMIYRGTRFCLASSSDRAEETAPVLVTMTYRGTTVTALHAPTGHPFGRRVNLGGTIYRGTRIEG